MDVVIRVSVRRTVTIAAPQIEAAAMSNATGHICTGVGPDLMEAARDAVRAMITHLGDRYGLEPEEAYALTSVACDLRIHELVDAPNWVVGAFLPDSLIG
jgi:formamidase